MMYLIDSHAHLFFDDFHDTSIDALLSRARENGVGCVINVGTTLETSGEVIRLAEKHPKMFAVVGVHPHEVSSLNETDLPTLKQLAEHPRVVAIGEIGLDYHYTHSPPDVQKKRLADQIMVAQALKLPLVIHCRDAFEDCFQVFDETQAWGLGGVFHCYTGDLKTAEKIIKKGFYVSFSGIVTFKKSLELQQVARQIPRDRFLIETDCPYLAPEPFRGRRNEPAYLVHVAEKIAALKQVTLEDITRITFENTRRVFRLPGGKNDDHTQKGKFVYVIRNSLYLNITNQCTLACVFCPKFDDWMVKGHYLELEKEPGFEEILKEAGDLSVYDEVVFCGFGESTIRYDFFLHMAKTLRTKGVKKIRLDTDGLANLRLKKNIVPDIQGLIDSVSISLNAPDPKTYQKICPNPYGEEAYFAVLDFIRCARGVIPEVIASVVGLPNLDVTACEKVAEELGVTFRLRPYQEVG